MSGSTKCTVPVKKVHARKLLTSLFVVMLCVALFSSQISALMVIEPVLVDGNPKLGEGCVRIPDPPVGEMTWKIDSAGVETNPEEDFEPADFWIKTVVMPATAITGEIFAFTSNYYICKVVVKGGDKAYVYEFPTPVKAYMGLHAPINASGKFADISHIDFCICNPAIDVEKLVSVDGGTTWADADTAPGPTLNQSAGINPKFKFVVTNTGNVDLTDIELTDDHYQSLLDEEEIPETLKAGASFTVVIEAPWAKGEHVNLATVVGEYKGIEVSDTDKAYYTGVEAKPAIKVTKTVSDAADGTYGDLAEIEAGKYAYYKVVVKNTGDVTLTGVILMDDTVAVGTEATIDGQAGVKTFANGGGDYPQISIGTLTPGQEAVVRYKYLTTDEDIGDTIENTAVAVGMYGQVKVSAEDTAAITVDKIPLAVSSIKLEKWVRNKTQGGVFAEMATGFVGDVFEYSIKITNDGDTNLTNVVLHDTFAKIGVDVHIYEGDVLKGDAKWVNDGSGHAKLVIGDLAAGASLTFKYLYTAVAADEGDVYENLAVVNAEFQGLPLEASDKAVITILETPPQTGESDGMALGGIVLLFTGALALMLRRKIRQVF